MYDVHVCTLISKLYSLRVVLLLSAPMPKTVVHVLQWYEL